MSNNGQLFKDKTYTRDFIKASGIAIGALLALLYFPMSKLHYYNGDNETFHEFLIKYAENDKHGKAKSYVQAYADPDRNLIRYSLSSNPNNFRAITTPNLMQCGYKFRTAQVAYAFEEVSTSSVLTLRSATRESIERYMIKNLCPKIVTRWKTPDRIRIIQIPNTNKNNGAVNE